MMSLAHPFCKGHIFFIIILEQHEIISHKPHGHNKKNRTTSKSHHQHKKQPNNQHQPSTHTSHGVTKIEQPRGPLRARLLAQMRLPTSSSNTYRKQHTHYFTPFSESWQNTAISQRSSAEALPVYYTNRAKKDPHNIDNYRPTILMNGVVKLWTSILANIGSP